MTTLATGELADLAAQLNGMIEAGTLVIVFQPYARRTEFAFRAMRTIDGDEGILAIAKVAG